MFYGYSDMCAILDFVLLLVSSMIMLVMADIMRILEAFGRASPSDRDGSRSAPSVEAIKQGNRHEKK